MNRKNIKFVKQLSEIGNEYENINIKRTKS